MLTKCIKYFFFLRKGYSIRKRWFIELFRRKEKKSKAMPLPFMFFIFYNKKKTERRNNKRKFSKLSSSLIEGAYKIPFSSD